ncbi:putative glycolipid-binding domain-containing protein [Massilia sp. 9I]|uniref:putative glycolipid-binding domain-containing protein n=1 Tax=Massilia sp. 9I TaxID=2653152 RepID=UPI0012F37B38|nr:putative glycolipid-binding domain-containing protein [Massilia sp. 9I]VXB74537.1 conserved hypothetical protein [Massilia sp. 9I]
MQQSYRWRPEEGPGLEHLHLAYREDVIVADAVVIGDRGDGAFGCSYRICCDLGWRVRSLEVHAAGGASLVLTSDGNGHWHDGDGRRQPQLDGCIDVDIAATPFTNTLPIRRLGAALAQRSIIAVAYVPLPSLKVERAEQAYTRLAAGRYLYENADGSFESELEVDADGLVLRYPSLFARLDTP